MAPQPVAIRARRDARRDAVARAARESSLRLRVRRVALCAPIDCPPTAEAGLGRACLSLGLERPPSCRAQRTVSPPERPSAWPTTRPTPLPAL